MAITLCYEDAYDKTGACWTEAHESGTAQRALLALQEKAEQFYRGEETMGVFSMYETAARDRGCDALAIHTAILNAKAHAIDTNTLRQQ
jgi:hypothetical protein